jgi:hypothetical protein
MGLSHRLHASSSRLHFDTTITFSLHSGVILSVCQILILPLVRLSDGLDTYTEAAPVTFPELFRPSTCLITLSTADNTNLHASLAVESPPVIES